MGRDYYSVRRMKTALRPAFVGRHDVPMFADLLPGRASLDALDPEWSFGLEAVVS